MQENNLIRLRGVMKKTGYSRSSVFRKSRDGEMPKPVRLGANSIAWVESEIDEWINSKIDQRNKQQVGQ